MWLKVNLLNVRVKIGGVGKIWGLIYYVDGGVFNWGEECGRRCRFEGNKKLNFDYF